MWATPLFVGICNKTACSEEAKRPLKHEITDIRSLYKMCGLQTLEILNIVASEKREKVSLFYPEYGGSRNPKM
jgi:hypothetical protein